LLETGKRPVERLASEPQLTRNVLKRPWQVHCAAGTGIEVEVEHHSFFCGAHLHQFQALPQLDDLMRHELEEGHRAGRIGAQGLEDRGFGIYAHPRRFRCHGVAMENFGKQRCFDKEFVGWCRAKDQQPAVEGTPFQPQPPLFNEINGPDFITLPKQQLVSAKRSSFKQFLIERQHSYVSTAVNMMPSQTASSCVTCRR